MNPHVAIRKPAPLDSFGVMHTHDPEAARHALLNTYGATGFNLLGSQEGFVASAGFVKLEEMALSYCCYDEQVQLAFPEATFVRQQICLGGSGQTSYGNHRIGIDASNWSAMVPAGVTVDFDYAPSFQQMMLWIETSRLDRALTAMSGSPRAAVSFSEQSDVNAPALQGLRRAIAFLATELNIAGKQCSPVALAEMEDMIVMRFLASHRYDPSEPTSRGWAPSRPQMRQLEDYLTVHWNEPTTIETLARVTGIGARSIFRYFKETRGCTPLEFMKSLRLERVRQALQHPHGTTSVSSEALRCGFNNMGHFAKDYRGKFGELPSETLARARFR